MTPEQPELSPEYAVHHLDSLRKCAKDVIQACDADEKTLAQFGRPVAELAALRHAATQVLDGFVLRYAVAGDCNAGKSLLTAALLGSGGALRAEPMAETGNVTVLRVTDDGPADQAAVLGPYQLTFFTTEQTQECLAFLVEEAARELDKSKVGELAQELRAIAATSQVAAQPLLDWARATLPTLPTGPDIGNRLIELVRFCASWVRYAAAVVSPHGTQITVTEPVAKAAMRLPQDAVAEPTDASHATSVLTAILADAAAPPLTVRLAALTEELARGCYPLVRDIRVDVRVPKAVWDFGSLHVPAIELFDFPGLRASSTAARDRHLSVQELKADRVHAWLVVLNASNLAGTMATGLIRELGKDRVLAVANQFDKLQLDNEGYLRKLLALADPNAPPVTPAEVTARVVPLGTVVTQLSELALPEWTVVASALLGLNELNELPEFRHRIITEDQRLDWSHIVENGERTRKELGRLAERIAHGDRLHPLAGWLAEYAQPGGQAGLVALRQRLAKHARRHGLVQLARERQQKSDELWGQTQKCVNQLTQPTNESHQKRADAIRRALATLSAVLREGLPSDGSLDDLPLAEPGLRADATTSARELVRDEVLAQVHEWPAWKALFQATGPDGYVEYIPPGATGRRRVFAAEAPPMRACDLLKAYRDTYRDVERVVLDRAQAALQKQLDLVAKALDLPTRELLATRPVDESGQVLTDAMEVNSERMRKVLLKQLQPATDADRDHAGYWLQRFPFLMSNGADGGPYFGWATERRADRGRNPSYHVTAVFRLRHELASAIEANVLRDVAIGLQAFHREYAYLVEDAQSVAEYLRRMPDDQLLAIFRYGRAVVPSAPRLQLSELHAPPRLPG